MTSVLLLAATLLIRNLVPVDGTVVCALHEGESLLAAYSVEVNPLNLHALRETKADRLAEARTGRVGGLAAGHHLVLAVAEPPGEFDRTRPVQSGREVFPYSDEMVAAYRRISGRDYVTDMMLVVVPFVNNGWTRDEAARDLYRAAMSVWPDAYSSTRSFGPADGKGLAVVYGRYRTLNWLDRRAFGDEGVAVAEAAGGNGWHVDLVPSSALGGFSVDADGWMVFGGRRLATVLFRHLDGKDAARYSDLFGGRRLRTRVLAYDAPTLVGSETVFSDDPGDAETSGR